MWIDLLSCNYKMRVLGFAGLDSIVRQAQDLTRRDCLASLHLLASRCARQLHFLAQAVQFGNLQDRQIGDPNKCVEPRLGIQTPMCGPGWGSQHLCVAPVGDPNTWTYSNTCL